jgi:hypothetical protein
LSAGVLYFVSRSTNLSAGVLECSDWLIICLQEYFLVSRSTTSISPFLSKVKRNNMDSSSPIRTSTKRKASPTVYDPSLDYKCNKIPGFKLMLHEMTCMRKANASLMASNTRLTLEVMELKDTLRSRRGTSSNL